MALSQYLGQLTLFVHRIGNLDHSTTSWANCSPSCSSEGQCARDSSINYMPTERPDYWIDDVLVNNLEVRYAEREQQKQTENTTFVVKENNAENLPNSLDVYPDYFMSNTVFESMAKKLACDFDENFRIDSSDLIKLLPCEQAAFCDVLLDDSSNNDTHYCSM
ncbi:hypothetical protein D918_04795 [Trichuris suis]|nr:hypothetical protein D918_04795 [Trichuris suis]